MIETRATVTLQHARSGQPILVLCAGKTRAVQSEALKRPWLATEAGSLLTVREAVHEDLALANKPFNRVAAGKTGFSRRQESFMEMMVEVGDILSIDQLRMIHLGRDLVGYAGVRRSDTLLAVNNLWLLAIVRC